MEKQKVQDPYSGEMFVPKRSNQKFATRQNQVAFNNDKQKANRNSKAFVDKYLDNNHKAIRNLLGNKNEIIASRESLLKMGFNFSYYTHIFKVDQQMAYGCYEFGIIAIDTTNFKIFKND